LCSESKGEKEIERCLKKYGINHIREYKIKPYPYRYDFYLPDQDIYIEYHGHQHYRPVELFGGEKGFEKTKERDIIKERLVRENKGRFLVIAYSCPLGEVENVLIRALKRIYRIWCIIEGQIKVFKTELKFIEYFQLCKKTPIRELIKNAESIIPGFKFLF